MTLTLLKSPPAVSLVGNDILFKVETDNQYLNYGSYAELIIRWTTGDSNGDSFTLAWGNKEIVFTCATTPDDSGLQYPAYTSGPVDDWVESLVPYFKANYLLSQDYTIVWQVSGSIIRIKSINNGTQYSFTLTPGTSNIIEYANTAGIDPVLRNFYQLVCRIWLQGSSDTLLGESRLDPDTDGYALFKIQEYLVNELTFHFEWPESSTTFLFKKSGIINRFYIEYAESYENEVKKLFSTEETVNYAILGGIDRKSESELNEADKTWWDQFLFQKDFLTNQPRELYVSKTQPVKLSCLVWESSVTSIKLIILVTYTDGLGTSITKTITAVQYDVFECILSVQKLGLESLSIKEIASYEVYITDQDDNRLSISRYFYIDSKYYENERIFIFQNSKGVADVVRFTGISEANVALERNSAVKINQEGFTWRNFEIEDYDNLEIQKFKINSGWLNDLAIRPKQYADYLREFYLSPKIYELVNNRLYPIRILSKKQQISQSDESLISMEFEAERAYTDKYFSQDENIHPGTGFESKFESEEYLNPK